MEMCAGLKMNFDKVTVLPLHADGWDALRECLVRWGNGWENAQLAMCARWLGWRIGLHMTQEEFQDAACKILTRIPMVKRLHLGAPAAIHMAKLVLGSVATHQLRGRRPLDVIKKCFQTTFRHLTPGPREWLPHCWSWCLRELGIPCNFEDAERLSLRLHFLAVLNLSCSLAWLRGQLLPSSLPDLQGWQDASSIVALGRAVEDGVRGNLFTVSGRREGGRVILTSRIRRELGNDKNKFKAIFAKWLQTKQPHFRPRPHALADWLESRVVASWGPSFRRKGDRMLANLGCLRDVGPPRAVNAYLRILIGGVAVSPDAGLPNSCLFVHGCRGYGGVDHYVN
eukprot:5031765-Amphidinium_carterae.1